MSAYAVPPRGEIIMGWSGNADHGFGFTTVQPALVRGEDGQAAFLFRATVSELYYSFITDGQLHLIRSPGLAAGPGIAITEGPFGLSASVGLEARRPTPDLRVVFDANLAGGVSWRPAGRASVYAQTSFSAVQQNVWLRAGAMMPVFPIAPRDTAASLWLGLETTRVGSGPNQVQEVGAVAEVPIRDLHAAINVRAGVAFQELGRNVVRRGTVGIGLYWSYY